MESALDKVRRSYRPQSDAAIHRYVFRLFRPECAALREIRQRSRKRNLPPLQVGPMEALHLEILARSCDARNAVEIGSLGGYSAVSLLRGLGKNGKLYCLESSPACAQVTRESIRKAGFLAHAEILLGPALENLPALKSKGPFDLVFIDADKPNYCRYLTWAAENLRVGGVLLADNVYALGRVARRRFRSAEEKEAVLAIQKFNTRIARSKRFRATILPTSDGLAMAVKLR